MIIPVYSKVYLEIEDNSWCAIPSNSLLHTVSNHHEFSSRWIAKIGTSYIALGDPVHNYSSSPILYLPTWFCQQMNHEGDGTPVDVELIPAENFTKASALEFKVLGSIPDDFDIREILEEPLSRLGILQKGQIIPCPVPLEEDCSLLVKSCSPEDIVFLDGSEIALEVEHERPPTPMPSPITNPITSNMVESMLPLPPLERTSTVTARTSAQNGFVSFSGTGYRLGSM
jgi:hypothetical protein